jgi:hypothetical protein
MLRPLLALAMIALAGGADAAVVSLRVMTINDHLLAFYDGRPPAPAQPKPGGTWADTGALDVGVATYVIHQGDQALVYDSFPYAEEARFVRDYLTKAGIRHFVLDIGAGYELEANARWSSMTLLFSVAATSVFWAFVLLH